MTISVFLIQRKRNKKRHKNAQPNRTLSEQEIKEFTTKFTEVA